MSIMTDSKPQAVDRPGRARRLRGACCAWLVVAAIGTVIGVAERWPAQFGGKGVPSKTATQWITHGTVLSPPLFMLIAMAIALALVSLGNRRAVAVFGAVVALLVTALATVFTLGEMLSAATPAVPRGAQLSAVVGTMLSIAVVVTSVALLSSIRSNRAGQ